MIENEAEMIGLLEKIIAEAEWLNFGAPELNLKLHRTFIYGAREHFEVGEWFLSYTELEYLADADPKFNEVYKNKLSLFADYFERDSKTY